MILYLAIAKDFGCRDLGTILYIAIAVGDPEPAFAKSIHNFECFTFYTNGLLEDAFRGY